MKSNFELLHGMTSAVRHALMTFVVLLVLATAVLLWLDGELAQGFERPQPHNMRIVVEKNEVRYVDCLLCT